jgi:phospholipid/cholesterol/gamma-HCH transport system substrate-binding protein
MRDTRALQIKVGLLIAVSLAVLAAAIFLMGKERRLFESKVSYTIHFSRASGLREGSPISLSGVRVGSVESLSFPPDPRENYIIVHVGVVKEAAPRIRKDMTARLRTQGLLGDKYIDLSGGSADSAPVPPRGVIPSAEPLDYERLLGESGDVIGDVAEAASSLKTILKSIEQGKGFLGQAMVDDGKWSETMNNLRLASVSLKNILATVERGEGMVGQLVQNREAGQAMMRDLRTTLAHLSQASESLQKTAQKI